MTYKNTVKRLFREAKELHEATEEYYAQPLEDNLFEWHFTVRGPADSEFDGGVYHGRIIMPADYPMKPPNIIFLTPNGRFETNKKICLSISGHHPETWQPSWSIRTALLAIIGFMPTPANGTIGSLDYTAAERAVLAKRSQKYQCPQCGCVAPQLLERTSDNLELQAEAREVMGKVAVTVKAEGKEEASGSNTKSDKATPPSSPSSNDSATPTPTQPTTDSPTHPTTHPAVEELSNTSPSPSSPSQAPRPPQETENASPEILMEEVPTRTVRANSVSSMGMSGQSYLYNFVLSSAIFLFIALVIRRIFLLEGDTPEEFDDILL
ncbi:Ubiquitin-conjugating enzyme E2 J1 [Chionoecetes opilio]|uniref:Ubiquitin-conjugating enzyme E2 J1 n=1 Tax=Chionoecetes opilio TaxID=41210 RepID=A0A8J5BT35_CHIOP|nr:Ubiquitin-conjugating enzyme E2 J1 [Chionoecetes opilio]